MRTSRNYTFWRTGIAIAAVLLATSPAPAFYWSLKSIPSVITPGDSNNPGNPPQGPTSNPLPLPPDTPVPGGGPGGPGTPGSVPEPTTAAAGIIGLCLVGMRRWIRSRHQ